MEKDNVPFIVHEADMARLERINRRLALVLIFVTAGLFLKGWKDERP